MQLFIMYLHHHNIIKQLLMQAVKLSTLLPLDIQKFSLCISMQASTPPTWALLYPALQHLSFSLALSLSLSLSFSLSFSLSLSLSLSYTHTLSFS